MKRTFLAFCMTFAAMAATASTTLPIQGTIIRPTNKNIQYIGRICFDQPERPRFTFPGVQINGADWHPSIWQHQFMAAELTSYLRQLMQWF